MSPQSLPPAPQQKPDYALTACPADPARPGDPDGHLEDLAAELRRPTELGCAAGQHEPGGQHPRTRIGHPVTEHAPIENKLVYRDRLREALKLLGDAEKDLQEREDNSWAHAARVYLELYETAVARRRGRGQA